MLDDASQQVTGSNYWANATELRITASTTVSQQRAIGLRFIGTIPANTKSVPQVSISGFIATGTQTGINCKIYLQKSLTTNAFRSDLSAGVDDVISRPRTSASVNWVEPFVNGDDFTTPELTDLFKELMQDLGGAIFDDIGNPLVSSNGTQQDIVNPTIILVGNTLPSGSNQEARFLSFDNITDPISAYKTPCLGITVVPMGDIQVPSDRRTHIAILSDSIGWSLMPGGYFSEYATGKTDTLMSFATSLGVYQNGMFRIEHPPGAFISLIYNGQPYSIDDPYGQGGMGAIKPEGRQGYTPNGILKDRLIEKFGVADTDIVIHAYGLGGTTAGPCARTTGTWSSTKGTSESYQSLSTISNPGGDLSSVLTNPLWNYVDSTGHTLITLLRDTSIERLLVLYIGGGNDAFGTSYQGGAGKLPMSLTQSVWDNQRNTLITAYEDIFRFCRDVRSAASGTDLEFLLVGYPNMPTDDPRVTPINVYEGAPPSGAYHRNSWPAITDPDPEYGGSNGAGGLMAPYGTGSVNVIPYIPWFLHYTTDPSKVTTNVQGVVISGLPRPAEKADLGMFLQIKSFNYCTETFFPEYYGTRYRDWYAHWGADHYGYRSDFLGGTNVDKWNNAKGFFGGTYNSSPYSAASQGNIPWNNLKIAIPYCARAITNQTVNGMLQYVTGTAAVSAVSTLQSEGLQIQYVDLWNSLGSSVGSGVTASGGTAEFLDGVHLTQAGSETFADSIIDRARPNSPMLQTLTDWSHESTARFMPFFDTTA